MRQHSATFAMEIACDSLTVVREELELGPGGWLNFAKEYTTFGPDVGVVVYHPPTDLKARISVYAGA